MDRGSTSRKTVVINQGGGFAALGVLGATIIAVIVIVIVIVYARRTLAARNAIENEGSSECLSNFDCDGGKLCDPIKKTCVACYDNSNCPSQSPICDLDTNTCKSCVTNSDCPSDRPTCDLNADLCVECSTNAECGGARPICSPQSRTCVQCASSSDCGGATPLCNPINVCVECLSNFDCAIGTCNSGFCCDLTPPTILSIFNPPQTNDPNVPGSAPLPPNFIINYAVTQPLSFLSGVILLISDFAGNPIITTPVQPVTGSLYYVSPTQNARLYYDFTYKFRLQLVTACGTTPPSSEVTSYAPIPLGNVPMNIVSGTANPQFVEIILDDIRGVLGCNILTIDANIRVSLQSQFEPNSGASTFNTITLECDPIGCGTEDADGCKLFSSMPIVVAEGQTVWIRTTQDTTANLLINRNYASNAFPIMVGPAPPII